MELPVLDNKIYELLFINILFTHGRLFVRLHTCIFFFNFIASCSLSLPAAVRFIKAITPSTSKGLTYGHQLYTIIREKKILEPRHNEILNGETEFSKLGTL